MVTIKKTNLLYQQALLQHHKNPTGFNQIISFNFQAQGTNAACGDEISVQLELVNNEVKAVAFSGDSCAICRASASILCQQIPGKTPEEANDKLEQIFACLKGLQTFDHDSQALAAVSQYPVRKQCALLPWTTLQEIILAISAQVKPAPSLGE